MLSCYWKSNFLLLDCSLKLWQSTKIFINWANKILSLFPISNSCCKDICILCLVLFLLTLILWAVWNLTIDLLLNKHWNDLCICSSYSVIKNILEIFSWSNGVSLYALYLVENLMCMGRYLSYFILFGDSVSSTLMISSLFLVHILLYDNLLIWHWHGFLDFRCLGLYGCLLKCSWCGTLKCSLMVVGIQ